jgi:hypothetical protein
MMTPRTCAIFEINQLFERHIRKTEHA